MSNNIRILNLDPQEITINGAGTPTGITNVYVNGVDVTVGTKAYVIVPTKLSELTNDEGFITNAEETDPTVPYYVKEITLADINAWNDKQDLLVSGTSIKTINGNSLLGSGNLDVGGGYTAGYGIDISGDEISNTITSYNDLTDLPTIPTNTSDLTNDSGFINKYVNDLENYLNIDLLSNILPKSADSGDGELYLEDSAKTKLNITLNPHEMVQHTTTGKNLFDKDTITPNKVLASDGALNDTPGYIVSDYIKVNPSTSYTLQFVSSGITELLRVGYYDNDKTFLSRPYSADNPWTITTPNNCDYIRVCTPEIYQQVQVEEGSTSTPYEEYTGGMPSPNPLYPQDIHWTSGDNTIKVGNKNLFDENQAQIGKAWNNSNNSARAIVLTKVKPSETYTISYDTISGIDGLYYFGRENENDNTATMSTNSVYSNPLTITTTADTNWLGLQFNKTSISQTDINNVKTQIEKGSEATSYVEHEEIEYTVNLEYPENYCKIDDYADRYFKNVAEDPDYSITLNEGAWYQKLNIFSVYLSDNNNFESVTEYSDFYLFVNHNPNVPGRPPVSDPYGRSTVFGVDKGGIITNNKIEVGVGYINIYLDKKVGISTLEDLSDWINNNDIIVWFKSAVPEVENASNQLSEQFETLKNDVVAFDGGTNISQENEDLPFDIEASTFKKVN